MTPTARRAAGTTTRGAGSGHALAERTTSPGRRARSSAPRSAAAWAWPATSTTAPTAAGRWPTSRSPGDPGRLRSPTRPAPRTAADAGDAPGAAARPPLRTRPQRTVTLTRVPAGRAVRGDRPPLLRSGSRRRVGGPHLEGVLARAWRPSARTTAARCPTDTVGASVASCHGPSSTRTSTRRMPRCWAHATPATVTGPAVSRLRRAGRVDAGLGLDRALRRPAARHPVRVEVVEAGELELGHPLGGRDVAVEAGHHHADREAVLDRQRLAVHADGEQGVAAVAQHGGRGAAGPAVDRAADDLVGAVLAARPRRAGPRAARRASGRCRSGRRRPRWRRRPA